MSHSRLHVNATFMGFRRGKHIQHTGTALVKLDGVHTVTDARFYVGKRVAYIYKVQSGKTSDKPAQRVIYGKVIAPHGTNGIVRAKFQHNLPPKAIGQQLRVYLYPSAI